MVWGHSKSMFARDFQYSTPYFPCSSLSLEFSNGKLVSVFVNSKDKLLIFFTVVYIFTLKVFTYSSKKVK